MDQQSQPTGFRVPSEFFSHKSIATLAGAAAATWVVTTAIASVFSTALAITGFVVAVAIAYLGFFGSKERGILPLGLTFVNGCLIYLVVVGGSSFAPAPKVEAATAVPGETSPTRPAKPAIRPWVFDTKVVKELAESKRVIADTQRTVETLSTSEAVPREARLELTDLNRRLLLRRSP